jgi:hypothetical protein
LPLSLLAYAYFGVCASSPYCAAAGRPPPPWRMLFNDALVACLLAVSVDA